MVHIRRTTNLRDFPTPSKIDHGLYRPGKYISWRTIFTDVGLYHKESILKLGDEFMNILFMSMEMSIFTMEISEFFGRMM